MLLLSIAKLQNLKAIHNSLRKRNNLSIVVINRKTTKFESNSQLKADELLACFVVINRKTTKFKGDSRHKCLIYQIVQQ